MNRIRGTVKEIVSEKSLSLVRVERDGVLFTSVVIGDAESIPALKIGAPISLLFKESEVVIATGSTDHISLRNRIPGQISHLELGNLLATITIDTSLGPVTSIITRNAVNNLGLEIGRNVTAMIKTNEMMLSV